MNQDNQNKTRKRIVTTTGTPVTEIGKLPPQSVELEEAVLGACLLEKEAIQTVSLILQPESFYKEQNAKVFRACQYLYNKNEAVDILTVTQELKRLGELEFVGGSYYVSALTNRIASSANIEFHARIVQQKFLSRELIRLGTEVIKESYEDNSDVFETIANVQMQLRNLTTFLKTKIQPISDVFADMVSNIIKAQDSVGGTGVPSGFPNIDRVTGGWQKGDLYVGAARPGMGKTAFILAAAKNAAVEFKKPVAVFSLEMTAVRLVGRLSASEAEISSTKINQGTIERDELMALGGKCSKLINAPIYIDDTPNLDFETLRMLAIQMVSQYGVEMIYIDYLQLMKGNIKGNREAEISYISRNLKGLAKELNIPIFALSQLSRTVENRDNKNIPEKDKFRPQLSDLRESGAIEQDADCVMFFFRPEYYQTCAGGYPYKDGVMLETENLMLVDFAKGREMALVEVPLLFYGKYMQIKNYDLDKPQPPPQLTLL